MPGPALLGGASGGAAGPIAGSLPPGPAGTGKNGAMSATLACCWAFAPWRSESATSAAAWLTRAQPHPLDVVRGDLDGLAPREQPRPAIDARIARSLSVPTAGQPLDAAAITAYVEASLRTVTDWAATGAWEVVYSGPAGLADHVLAAAVREAGLAQRWTAHLRDLPTHGPGGARHLAVLDSADPGSGSVSDWVLGMLAGADALVFETEALAEIVTCRPAFLAARTGSGPTVEVWQRPGQLAGPGYRPAEGTLAVAVDAQRLARLEPVLTAYALLSPAEQSALPVRIHTNDAGAIAAALRRRGLEGRIEMLGDLSPAARVQGAGGALVLDPPAPEGLPWSPAGVPEVADSLAAGLPVVLVAEQDSPLTDATTVRHIPAAHVSASLACLREFASARSGFTAPG